MMKAILVDDNKIELRNISYLLNKMDDVELVATFSNGEDAYNYLWNNQTDILITDIQMPRMDGLELVKSIRRDKMKIEIILISGYSDFENAKKAVGLDISAFIMKPIIDDELNQAVITVKNKNKQKQIEKSQYDNLVNQIKLSEGFFYGQYVRNLIAGNMNKDADLKFLETIFNKFKVYYNVVFVIKLTESDFKTKFADNCVIIDELLKLKNEDIDFYPAYMSEDEITVVTICNDKKKIIDEIVKLRNQFMEKYNFNMIFVISGYGNNVYDSDKLYNECKKVLENISLKSNRILICEGEESQDYSSLNILNLQEKIIELIYSGDRGSIKNYISENLSELSSQNNQYIRNFAYIYVNILEIALSEVGKSFDDSLQIKDIWNKLIDFESILSLQNFLENLTYCVINILNKYDLRTVKIVESIKEIIAKNYQNKISIDDIAKELNFSKRQLQRVFSKNMGISIFDYLINYRIDKAKELIKKDVPIKDVAEMTGYNNYMYFSAVFKEKTGKTPKEYRMV